MKTVSAALNNHRLQAFWALLIFSVMAVLFNYPILLGQLLSQTDYLYFISPWSAYRPDSLVAAANPYLQDQSTEFLPFFLTAKAQILQGMWPLWNPYIFAGTPLLANTQSALLFPLNWGHFVLPPGWGFSFSALLKLSLAGWFTYLYARRMQLASAPSLLAGVAFSFCAFNIFWLNHPHTNVTVLIPLCFYALENLIQKSGAKQMAILAVVIAMTLFAGHVEIAFLAALAGGVYFIVRAWQLQKHSLRLWLLFAAAYGLSLLLSAVMIGPFLEFLGYAAIWEERTADMIYTMPMDAMVTAVFGNYFRVDGWQKDFIGYQFSALYVGATALPLIALGLIKAWRPLLPWLFVLLIAMLLAFDIGPFFDGLRLLPLFSHLPMFYWTAIIAFALSIMAAWGWQVCLNGPRNTCIKIIIWASLILLLALLALFWQSDALQKFMTHPQRLDQYIDRHSFYVGLLVSVVSVLMLLVKRYPRTTSVLIVTLLFADLTWFGHDWNPTVETAHVFPQETPEAVKFLRQQQGPFRVLGLNRILKPSTNMLVNLEEVRGYDVPVSQRYHRFFKQALGGDVAYWVYEKTKLEKTDKAYLNMLNVRYILSKNNLTDYPELNLVYDKEIKVYENSEAESRLFARFKQHIVADQETALSHLLAAPEILHDTLILEADSTLENSQNLVAASVSDDLKPAMTFEIKERNSQQLEAVVNMPQDGWLVRSAAYYPGWKAYVDNQQVAIHPANYVLQAVWLPAGVHQLRFSYQPWSFTGGWIISLLALLGVLWILIKSRK